MESENDRIRWAIAAKGMGFGTDSERPTFIRRNPSQGEHALTPRDPGGSNVEVPRSASVRVDFK